MNRGAAREAAPAALRRRWGAGPRHWGAARRAPLPPAGPSTARPGPGTALQAGGAAGGGARGPGPAGGRWLRLLHPHFVSAGRGAPAVPREEAARAARLRWGSSRSLRFYFYFFWKKGFSAGAPGAVRRLLEGFAEPIMVRQPAGLRCRVAADVPGFIFLRAPRL